MPAIITSSRPLRSTFLIWGPSNVNLLETNAHLRAQGMPRLTNPVASIGGGGYGRFGRWIVGGMGEGGGSQARHERSLTWYGYGGGGQIVGFTLLRLLGLSVTPLLGFGGAGMGAQTLGARPTVVEPKRSGRGGALLFVGLLFELHVPLLRGWGPLGGLMLGYRFTKLAGTNSADFDLPGNHRDGISGFFARVVMGLGRN
jgi:hypothetical protein